MYSLITDKLTRFYILEAMPNQEAEMVLKKFVMNMLQLGFPRHVFTDRGTQFTSRLAEGLAKMFGMNCIYTSKFNPRSDGQTENLNQTVLNTLAKICEVPNADDWGKHLPYVAFAYNSTPHAVTRVAPYTALFGCSPNEPSSSLLDAAPSVYTYDRDDFLTSLRDRLQGSWSSYRAVTAEQQEKQQEFERQKLKDSTLQVRDWVFENNPMLKNRAKCGKLSLPYCGPYQVIKLNRNARMAKLQVLRGHDKWVHMQWLSHCDPKMLECKWVEPWYRNYSERCSLQAIPDEEEPTTGDNVSTGDQFLQRGRGAPEKRHSPEEKLRQKLRESEASVDYSKFEPDSPDFDDEGME